MRPAHGPLLEETTSGNNDVFLVFFQYVLNSSKSLMKIGPTLNFNRVNLWINKIIFMKFFFIYNI